MMKTGRALLSFLLAAVMAFSLSIAGGAAAFAEGGNPAEAAQEYDFVCTRMSVEYLRYATGYTGEMQPVKDHYVAAEYDSYYVKLNADGTGYLFLGENNQGPIDNWIIDGNLLSFQAGVSAFDGTILDGIMTLDFGEGLFLIFAIPGADTTEIKNQIISLQAFADLVLGKTEGVYSMFAMGFGGQVKGVSEQEGSSVLTLNEGGTGSFSFDEDTMDISSWTVDGNAVTVTLADGSSSAGVIHREHGVIEMDISGYTVYYCREGADTEAYLAPTSRLSALYNSIDALAGAHLSYRLHTDFMDANSVYDVHAKDGAYYSAATVQASGFENTTATFYKDGTVYSLNLGSMTGMSVMSVPSGLLANNPLTMDTLYAAILSRAVRSDFTTETREVDGVTYTVDIYPAGSYEAEGAFYFDDAGNLVRYVEGPPVIETGIDIGESVYTIESIDTAVNEALFDISGYNISN